MFNDNHNNSSDWYTRNKFHVLGLTLMTMIGWTQFKQSSSNFNFNDLLFNSNTPSIGQKNFEFNGKIHHLYYNNAAQPGDLARSDTVFTGNNPIPSSIENDYMLGHDISGDEIHFLQKQERAGAMYKQNLTVLTTFPYYMDGPVSGLVVEGIILDHLKPGTNISSILNTDAEYSKQLQERITDFNTNHIVSLPADEVLAKPQISLTSKTPQ